MNRLLVLTLTLLLAGCSSRPHVDPHGTIAIDPTFSPAQAELVVRAMDAWQRDTHDGVHLQLVEGPATITVRLRDLSSFDLQGMTDLYVGWADVWLDPVIMGGSASDAVPLDAVFQSCAMHELGHVFDLDHVDGTLMRPNGYSGLVVDPNTLSRFQAVN
jgi:hypothetical protein